MKLKPFCCLPRFLDAFFLLYISFAFCYFLTRAHTHTHTHTHTHIHTHSTLHTHTRVHTHQRTRFLDAFCYLHPLVVAFYLHDAAGGQGGSLSQTSAFLWFHTVNLYMYIKVSVCVYVSRHSQMSALQKFHIGNLLGHWLLRISGSLMFLPKRCAIRGLGYVCVCACVRKCVRACVRERERERERGRERERLSYVIRNMWFVIWSVCI
jgi:hypothetical protein